MIGLLGPSAQWTDKEWIEDDSTGTLAFVREDSPDIMPTVP